MEKYDFEMCLQDNTSTGEIVKYIADGSTVLEFGCANGRMTRYLNEAKGCHMCIVEINEAAYQEAVQYAEDGVNGDIMAMDWVTHFSGRTFDYILFADVLEHLSDPEAVLRQAGKLLKSDGKILVSYPNIAHSDILNNLYDNSFVYTEVGLLDNTHIHFAGRNDLAPMAMCAGLMLMELNKIIVPPFQTEQTCYMNPDHRDEQEARIIGRVDADVYQYICVLCKKIYFEANHLQLKESRKAVPHGVRGTFWDEAESGEQLSYVVPCAVAKHTYQYRLEQPKGEGNICFQPFENKTNRYAYALKSIKIQSEWRECEFELSEFFDAGEYHYALNQESCIVIKRPSSGEPIFVELEIYPYADASVKNLIEAISEEEAEKEAEEETLEAIEDNNTEGIDEKPTTIRIELPKKTSQPLCSTLVDNGAYNEIQNLQAQINGARWDLVDAQYDANRLAKMYVELCEDASKWMGNIQNRKADRRKFSVKPSEVISKKDTYSDKPRVRDAHAQPIPETAKEFPWAQVYPAPSAGGTVAVHLHLYYVDLLPEFFEFFSHIPYPFDLYVSCQEGADREKICREFAKLDMVEEVIVRATQNRGRDIAPMYVLFREEIARHDYFLHVHSKKSLYTGSEQQEWRVGAMKCLCGSETQVRKIFGVLQCSRKAGMFFPEMQRGMYFAVSSWLANVGTGMRLAQELGYEFSDGLFSYPVGSFFWAKTEALKPLFDRKFTYEDFDAEHGQIDGTLAHALERVVSFVAQSKGYTVAIGDSIDDVVRFGRSDRAFRDYFSRTIPSAKGYLAQHEAVSFDIFDTLITRKIYEPDDLFRIMGEKLKKKYGIEADFLKTRKKAEALAWQEVGAYTDIDKIYEHMDGLLALTPGQIQEVKQMEIELEYELCVPRKDVLEIYNYIKRKNIPIYLTSDMYLPADVVSNMLEKCGYTGWEKLYLSCEQGKRKDDGSLWKALKEEWKGINVVHVGDNFHSDVQCPGDLRIDTCTVLSGRDLFALTPLKAKIMPHYHDSIASSYLLGNLVNVYLFNSPFALLDAEHLKESALPQAADAMFGPLLTAFVQEIEAGAAPGQQLLFLSREGYLLQKLYQIYVRAEKHTENPNCYFLASRRATGTASIRNKQDIINALDDYYHGPLSNLLRTRLGIEAIGGDEIVEMSRDIGHVVDLLENVLDDYFQETQSQRERYTNYCMKVLTNTPEPPKVIDLGYSGSIQYYLSKLLGKKIEGFYLFTENRQKPPKLNCKFRGMFSRKLDGDSGRLAQNTLYLESILSAPYGQLLRFDWEDDSHQTVVPVYGEADPIPEEILTMQEALCGYVAGYAATENLLGVNMPIDPDLALSIFLGLAETNLLPYSIKSVFTVEDNYCGNGVKSVDAASNQWR